MDSGLAADPVVRRILETLATLEKAAGVRAHYRVLEPPTVESTDLQSLQTLARVLGDWIGLRNAMFEVTIIEHDNPPSLFRIDPDHEVFAMELPAAALTAPDTALAAVTRQVARAYLINSNIAASSVDPERSSGSLADVTAVFLGMGKLIMNASPQLPARRQSPASTTAENEPLPPDYLAFTHRLVCAMRGLDWAQHISGLNQTAIANLRKWDVFRDSVFSQSLRNVLTASASHRPLMDAIEDNHLALARFDQLQRSFAATVIAPLQKEMEIYHATCREGAEKLNIREQDTYDPCLLYINQLRRRMDLQRFADELQSQQDLIIRRLKVLTAGLSDLAARNLVHLKDAEENLRFTHCPFDGTPVSIENENHDIRVKCSRCGYAFLATPGIPAIDALRINADKLAAENAVQSGSPTDESEINPPVSTRQDSTGKQKPGTGKATPNKPRNKGALWLGLGIAILPMSWLPMIGYVVAKAAQGEEAPLTGLLGQIGVIGSGIGVATMALGLLLIMLKWGTTSKDKP